MDIDLLLAAAAKTSAMLLLKVSGIADEPEVSEFLNNWLLLDLLELLDVDVEVELATSEVAPRLGPLVFCCFKVGSLSNCIKFLPCSSCCSFCSISLPLAMRPMYIKSLLTLILVGMGGGDVT